MAQGLKRAFAAAKATRMLECECCGKTAPISPWPRGWFESWKSTKRPGKIASWCSERCVNTIHPSTL